MTDTSVSLRPPDKHLAGIPRQVAAELSDCGPNGSSQPKQDRIEIGSPGRRSAYNSEARHRNEDRRRSSQVDCECTRVPNALHVQSTRSPHERADRYRRTDNHPDAPAKRNLMRSHPVREGALFSATGRFPIWRQRGAVRLGVFERTVWHVWIIEGRPVKCNQRLRVSQSIACVHGPLAGPPVRNQTPCRTLCYPRRKSTGGTQWPFG